MFCHPAGVLLYGLISAKDVSSIDLLLDVVEAGVIAIIRCIIFIFQGAHDLMIQSLLKMSLVYTFDLTSSRTESYRFAMMA